MAQALSISDYDSFSVSSFPNPRAQKSGLFHLKIKCNQLVEKGAILATITDPYGKMKFNVMAPNKGYIINVNQAPIVHQGDAIFHMSTKDDQPKEEERECLDE